MSDSSNDLIAALRAASTVQVVAAEPQVDGTVTLELTLDGSPITLSAAGLRIVRGSQVVTDTLRAQRDLRSRTNRLKHTYGTDTPVEELRAAGLPLYWNRDWLIAELEIHDTFAAVAREHGYNPSVVANYASRRHGLSVRDDMQQVRRALLARWAGSDGDMDYTQLARQFGVATSTARRWLMEAMQPD